MNRSEFGQRIAAGTLLLDGAMGTLLHGRGIPIDECFDELNISRPAVVAGIHQDYIAAGADILETNSFGANRYKLAAHGLETQVKEINTAAVVVARRVIEGSFKPVLLAGAVGRAPGAAGPGSSRSGRGSLCRADRSPGPAGCWRGRRRSADRRDD